MLGSLRVQFSGWALTVEVTQALGSWHFPEGALTLCDPSRFFFLTPKGNSLLSSLPGHPRIQEMDFCRNPISVGWEFGTIGKQLKGLVSFP